MAYFARSLLALVLLCAVGCSQPSAGTPLVPTVPKGNPPALGDDQVFRPTFATSDGQLDAGTAFVVSLPGRDEKILLSAIHLLGPDGGLERQVPASEIGSFVFEITLNPCFGGGAAYWGIPKALPILDARPLGEPSGAGDIMAFRLPDDAPMPPLSLADQTPKPGTRVWLAAQVIQGAATLERLHGATVFDGQEPGMLFYAFDDPELFLQATSGAPVLDAEGRVVAINLGGGTHQGQQYGIGNPVGQFRSHLETAAAAPGPG